MKNKITQMAVVTSLLVSTSVHAFWGSDITLEKEHSPVAPQWVKKNDDQVTRSVFEIDKSEAITVKNYLKEGKQLFRLKTFDFDNILTLDPTTLKLNYTGKEANPVREKYVELTNAVKLVVQNKVEQQKKAIIEREVVSQDYVMRIATLEKNQAGYRTDVQAVYDLKASIIAANEMSEQAVKDYSAQLVTMLNNNPSIKKSLKNKHFERPKMKVGSCSEPVKSKKTSIEVAYDVQGFCFSNKFYITKNTADDFITDTHLMSELKSKMTGIAIEKVKQGKTYKKEGGKEGFKQQIRAFSRGGIEDVKRAAKQKYGSTEKGLGYEIKRLNDKLASNNRKIASQKKNVTTIPHREITHSEELKALQPLSEQLDKLITRYLDASMLQIIGKPIKQSSEDYKRIELGSSKGILLVKDSYPGNGEDQVELFLINPSILEESKAIKKHFDGKAIPTRAAATADGLLLWQGEEAHYARIAPSLLIFLFTL